MIKPIKPAIPAEPKTALKKLWISDTEYLDADDAYMASSPGPMTPQERARALEIYESEANRFSRMSDEELKNRFRVTKEDLRRQREFDDAIVAAGGCPWDF